MLRYLGESKALRISNLFFCFIVLFVVVYEIVITRMQIQNKTTNTVLVAPIIATFVLFSFRYVQFQNSGLDLIRQDPATVAVSVAIVVITGVFYKTNNSTIRRKNNEENS